MSRPVTRDVKAETSRDTSDRPWWQTCSVEEFRTKVEDLTDDGAQALMAEINGVISLTGSVVSDVTREPEWRNRAKRALAFQTEKRGILTAFMHRRGEAAKHRKNIERAETVARAREMVAAGDTSGALLLVIDWIEGFGRK